VHEIPAFAAMLADMDASIGRILDKVAELGLSENTYILFLADNGAVPFFPPPGNERLAHPDTYPRPCFNHPLRGGKWTLFEGGIRVPFIVAGPGIAAKSQCDVPVTGWDILPTLCELAGYSAALPENVDGASFANLLAEGNAGQMDRTGKALVFHRYAKAYPHSSIREGDYKLIRFWKTKEVMLFDLAKDPQERNDLAAQMPEKKKAMEQALMTYLRSVDAEILSDYP
jgi:arylsulfatase A-like enzyme